LSTTLYLLESYTKKEPEFYKEVIKIKTDAEHRVLCNKVCEQNQ